MPIEKRICDKCKKIFICIGKKRNYCGYVCEYNHAKRRKALKKSLTIFEPNIKMDDIELEGIKFEAKMRGWDHVPLTETEAIVARYLIRRGYTVLKTGWPDFLVYSPFDNKGFAVEVKSEKDKLTGYQQEFHAALNAIGLKTLTWTHNGCENLWNIDWKNFEVGAGDDDAD